MIFSLSVRVRKLFYNMLQGGFMCHCQNNSCSQSHCCGSSHHMNCSCPCHQSASQFNHCHGEEGHQSPCNYPEKFLELADQAWMEVLKEKIKENIRANGKNLDELAKLIAEANHEKWIKKMENKQSANHYQEQLREFFHLSCSSSCHKD